MSRIEIEELDNPKLLLFYELGLVMAMSQKGLIAITLNQGESGVSSLEVKRSIEVGVNISAWTSLNETEIAIAQGPAI